MTPPTPAPTVTGFPGPRSNAGFSIIEMLVVFTVLAVAMLPLASVQFEARHQVSESLRQSQAVQIATSEIERVRTQGFANAVGDSGQVDVFTYQTRIVPDAANPFLQEVQVQVFWQYGTEQRSLTMASKQAAR